MGKKIAVDSATLFNKGLEVVEAHYLYGADYDDIEIVIHPQSIIHSMVETHDSSVLAQLGWPDMRLPILYTLFWPNIIYCSEITWPRLDLCKLGSLTFKAPDNVKYPSMDLAYAAGRAGGTMTEFKVVELTCEKHQRSWWDCVPCFATIVTVFDPGGDTLVTTADFSSALKKQTYFEEIILPSYFILEDKDVLRGMFCYELGILIWGVAVALENMKEISC